MARKNRRNPIQEIQNQLTDVILDSIAVGAALGLDYLRASVTKRQQDPEEEIVEGEWRELNAGNQAEESPREPRPGRAALPFVPTRKDG